MNLFDFFIVSYLSGGFVNWNEKRKCLFTGTVPVNKNYHTGTVPVNKNHRTGTVPVNKDYGALQVTPGVLYKILK